MPIRSTASTLIVSRSVPNEIHCPRCHKTDFVRFEHVINGPNTSEFYFCGACEHEWIHEWIEDASTERLRSAKH
jgi:hypothetical protein